MNNPMHIFQPTSDDDLLKARLFNKSRLAQNGCWEWMGKKRNGYGLFWHEEKNQSVHRLAYVLYKGAIPLGMVICHDCDNPSCWNPDHLRAGTQWENMQDRDSRGRRRNGAGEWHGNTRLTTEDVLEIRASTETTAALARKYGVAFTTVANVRAGISWQHLNKEASFTEGNI